MTYDVTGRVARITLNRPERGNGLTFTTPVELAACVERATPYVESHARCGRRRAVIRRRTCRSIAIARDR